MNARELILEADRIARSLGMNQSEWSNRAGMAPNGQTVSRLMARGDCRVSTLLSLLRPMGYQLTITKGGTQDGPDPGT